MKAMKVFGLLVVLAVLSGAQARAGNSIGVEFLGRDGSGASGATSGNPGTPGVNPNDTVGVPAVQQQYWNPVDDYRGSIGAEHGETQPLLDNAVLTTTVTLLFDCNDSWYNDIAPTNLHTPNAHLMNGVIKSSSGGGVPGVFIFTNVPEGQYDLYVYTDVNNDGVVAKLWDQDHLYTYYVKEQHQFYDTNTFIQGGSLTAASATNIGNYVKFSNLGTYGSGTIGVSGQWVSGGDGIGIAALQLVNTGPPLANTNLVSFLTQPINRRGAAGYSNVTFSVVTRGSLVSYQWYKGGTAVTGATAASYTPAPIAPTDNGATIYCVASNNVNSVQSSNAVLTVGQYVLLAAVDESLWLNGTRAGVEAGTYDTNTPDFHVALPTFFNVNEEVGNNFAERLSCLFVAPTTANYTFFVDSDDDSDLFLSTDSTPANKRMIAQEASWSNPNDWLVNAGGTTAREIQQKRSDQWSPDSGVTVPFASGIALVAGTSYYLEQVHHNGAAGGTHADATFKLVSQPDPINGSATRITPVVLGPYALGLNGGFIVITTQPKSKTVAQAQQATFTVAATSGYIGDASGTVPSIFYQWQAAPKGSSTFTNISGGTGTSYTTPVLALTDDGTQIRANLVAADVSSNSAIATLNVILDTNPPVVVGAGVFPGGTQVGLTFNKDLDPTTAGNAANYKVNGTAVTSVLVRTNVANETTTEMSLVSLIVPTPISNSFTVTVTGVKDLFGNTAKSNTVPGTVIGLIDTDIGSADGFTTNGTGIPGGDPLFVGSVTQWGPGSFDVFAGGNDIYNDADGFNFLWEPKTNSFDVQVRIVSVSPVNNWSAAAIEVREGPPTARGGGWELARHYFCKVDYGGPTACIDGSGTGANSYEYNARRAPGDPTLRETSNNGPGGSGGWAGTGVANPTPVPYPNAWIRIARVRSSDGTSDHLLGYSGNDGVTWNLIQNVDLNDAGHAGFATSSNGPAGPWPSVSYVGLGTTSHNNNTNSGTLSLPYSPIGQPYAIYGIYRNWGDTPALVAPPTLTFVHNTDGTLTLTYQGNLYSSTTVNGTYSLVSGAVNPYKVTPQAAGAAAATFYRAGP